jgi:hypothetical protein
MRDLIAGIKWRKLPPFSWSRGYIRFRLMLLSIGIVSSVSYYVAGAIKNPLLGISLWLFFLFFGYLVSPWMIENTRPCRDCDKNK